MLSRYGGVIGPVIFFMAAFIISSLVPGYSSQSQMISELGASGAEYALFFNYLGFFPNGIFITLFSIYLYRTLKINRLSPASAIFVGIHGLGMLLATWYSCDSGCNPSVPSTNQIIHNVIAGIKFPSLIVAIVIFGIQALRNNISKIFGIFSIASAILVLSVMAMFTVSVATREHTGEYQRLFIGLAYVWLASLSFRLNQFMSVGGGRVQNCT